jgi:hypothetical protein
VTASGAALLPSVASESAPPFDSVDALHTHPIGDRHLRRRRSSDTVAIELRVEQGFGDDADGLARSSTASVSDSLSLRRGAVDLGVRYG